MPDTGSCTLHRFMEAAGTDLFWTLIAWMQNLHIFRDTDKISLVFFFLELPEADIHSLSVAHILIWLYLCWSKLLKIGRHSSGRIQSQCLLECKHRAAYSEHQEKPHDPISHCLRDGFKILSFQFWCIVYNSCGSGCRNVQGILKKKRKELLPSSPMVGLFYPEAHTWEMSDEE